MSYGRAVYNSFRDLKWAIDFSVRCEKWISKIAHLFMT